MHNIRSLSEIEIGEKGSIWIGNRKKHLQIWRKPLEFLPSTKPCQKAKISYHDQPEAFVVKIGCRDHETRSARSENMYIYLYMYVTCIYKNFLQRTITYPTKREKEKHLQTCLGKGYVSSQEGISLNVVYHAWSTLISKKKCHLVNICSSLSSNQITFSCNSTYHMVLVEVVMSVIRLSFKVGYAMNLSIAFLDLLNKWSFMAPMRSFLIKMAFPTVSIRHSETTKRIPYTYIITMYIGILLYNINNIQSCCFPIFQHIPTFDGRDPE